MEPRIEVPPTVVLKCPKVFTEDHWSHYGPVFEEAQTRRINFSVGGGLATACYTGRSRTTKDLDLNILPADRPRMIDLITRAGFADFYDRLPYDRNWIYRGILGDGYILDLIWSMANQRAQVDLAWITQGPVIRVHDHILRVTALEELIWSKLYILQSDRCDWPDLINLLYSWGPRVRWEHLLERLAEDAPLLASLLNVFAWLCPQRAEQLPAWLWPRLRLEPPPGGASCEQDPLRVRLIDSRPWLGPLAEG